MKGPRSTLSAVEAAVEDVAPRWTSATRRGLTRGLRAGRAQVGMGRRSQLAAPALDASCLREAVAKMGDRRSQLAAPALMRRRRS